jgi:hypothetical protein
LRHGISSSNNHWIVDPIITKPGRAAKKGIRKK